MELFELRITAENKIWRKYFTFAEEFVSKVSDDVRFADFYLHNSSFGELKIQALSHKGDVVKSQSHYAEKLMPYFCEINNAMLIREDIFKPALFDNLAGVKFFTVKVDGDFEFDYKLLFFTNALDCVDREKSVSAEFTYLSKLVLDKSKIPSQVDGFFLSGWNRYGRFHSVVNSELKNRLLRLEHASEFLLFDPIVISE